MKFPRYWSKASFEALDSHEQRVSATCWRSSDQSHQEAHQAAYEAARRIVQRRLQGDHLGAYAYGQRTLREEVIQTRTDSRGDVALGITRNSYGVLVLCTARVMFIDVDLPPTTGGEQWRYFFARLWGRKPPPLEVRREAELLDRVEQFLKSRPDWGLRLYRTHGGFRLLATHATFDPAADETRAMMKALDADPLYMRLCREQQCFRARLTPKPWRCDHEPNRIAWPHENDDQRRRFERWLTEYEHRQSFYATCRFMRSYGTAAIDPEVAPVIDLHDHLTACEQQLPLA